ncbi:MAG: glycosyltransferase [Ignavibacteriaceae bacterium]
MSILTLIFASIFILFILFSFCLISISNRTNRPVNISDNLNISVIISARNERENVNTIIDAINNLMYPVEDYEVILVDDNSTDDTFEELKKKSSGTENISVTQLSLTGQSGKRNALTFGINQAKFPFILITDADCRPQSNWLKAYSEKFLLGYDMLFGIAPFYKRKNLVSKISCFENFRNSLVAFSMASIGLPYTAAARNFGFTKRAFKEIEGYSNTKDTLSGDDDLLLREAVKRKMKIGVVTEEGSFVYSETKNTFKEYFQQRARHTQTSFFYLKKHQFILSCWHLTNLILLLSPLLMFVEPLIGILFPAKLLADFIVTKSTQKEFGYKFSIVEIFSLQILYEIFLIIHFLNARFGKIKWK